MSPHTVESQTQAHSETSHTITLWNLRQKPITKPQTKAHSDTSDQKPSEPQLHAQSETVKPQSKAHNNLRHKPTPKPTVFWQHFWLQKLAAPPIVGDRRQTNSTPIYVTASVYRGKTVPYTRLEPTLYPRVHASARFLFS